MLDAKPECQANFVDSIDSFYRNKKLALDEQLEQAERA